MLAKLDKLFRSERARAWRAFLIQDLPRFDPKITSITVISTLLLVFNHYRSFTPYASLDRLLLYLGVPLLVIVLFFRESPQTFGFQLGDWKAGLFFTLAAILLMTPIIWWLGSAGGPLHQYYGQINTDGLPLPVFTFLELFGWEFLFRGWILFGYARKYGPDALWVQAVPFALAHIGKPELETLSTIFGGFAFGWVAWRTRSFLYPFLIHWYIFTLVVVVSGGVLGG